MRSASTCIGGVHVAGLFWVAFACACSEHVSEVPEGGVTAGSPESGVDAGTSPEDASLPFDGDAGPPAHAGNALEATFVHLFEWPWQDIAKECTQFLGPKGYAAVQVSPPSEHAILSGYPWWERYQTVDYALDKSRSGTKDEFTAMVQTCAAAGVDIYVDLVINHMTAQASGIGSNGTSFTKYAYPSLFAAADFHQPACRIADADYTTNANRVRTCELLGLADLDTGADHVQSAIAGYISALVAMGVRGFRVDAAKHISTVDLDAIIGRVAAAVKPRPAPYFFFEVTHQPGEIISPADYFDVGRASGADIDVTEFAYGAVGDAFLATGGTKLSALHDFGSAAWGLVPSERAVVFIANHDTQRAAALYYMNAPLDDLANVFMLAWPYGYPSILSGFAFDRDAPGGRDTGPTSDATGHTLPIYPPGSDSPACASSRATAPAGAWICEHRLRSAANMVAFRRVAASVPTVDGWWDNGANQIAFGRGDRGFVVINKENTSLSHLFQTKMSAGSYCDVVHGDFTANACSGATVAVDAKGQAQITVAAGDAVAIHAGARLP